MAWTDITDVSATWTGAYSDPQFGVPYNSALLYDGSHTYNEASTPFVIVWVDSSDPATVWI